MTTMQRTVVGLSLLVFLPGEAAAQDVASSLDALVRSGSLATGDGIYVTDTAGRQLKGDVVDVLSGGLTLVNGRRVWTLSADHVIRIERQDSLENGIWLGLAGGVGAMYAGCGLLGLDAEGCGYLAAYAFIPAVVGGPIIGALIDAAIRKTVYEAPGSTRVTVSPMLSNGGLGARMSVGW